MFGCYRTGEANDPETYVAAIAAVLAEYPEHVVLEITNPVTGIARMSKFLPSLAEISQLCDQMNKNSHAIEYLKSRGYRLAADGRWMRD